MRTKASFIEQIKLHQGLINKIVFMYAHSPDDQKDLRQEILTEAWRSFQRFRGDAKFSTWLYRVGINVAISSLKKQRIHTENHIDPSMDSIPPSSNGKELLNAILRILNPVEKSIVLLMIEGFKQPEIAEMLGISGGNVRIKIYRIREKLKKYGITRFVE